MGIKRLASVAMVAVASGVSNPAAAQTTLERVVVEYTRPVVGNFDNFMSTYFGGSSYFSSTSFSFPEGEAYSTVFAPFIKKAITPKAALTMDSCAMNNAASARAITKDSEPTERVNAAREIYFQNLPNFINIKKDGLIFAVIFGDASVEQYQHTTFYGVIPMNNTFVPGTGVKRC